MAHTSFKLGFTILHDSTRQDKKTLELERTCLMNIAPKGFLDNYGVELRIQSTEFDSFASLDSNHCGFKIIFISCSPKRMQDAYILSDRLRDLGVHVVFVETPFRELPTEAIEYADTLLIDQAPLHLRNFIIDFLQDEPKRVYSHLDSHRFVNHLLSA